MRKLNWDLWRLQEDNKDRSFGTRRARSYVLKQAADTLHELGFKGLRARGIRRKHVEALVREWRSRELSAGTIKNRLVHVRWWADRVGRPGVVAADNAAYGIGDRVYVTNEDRSRELDADKLAFVTDSHVRMSLRLQAAFGLRREEAIKFSPSYADRGSHIALKATWTKGGRARTVPVVSDAQRAVLAAARELVGGGALIAPGRNYREQRQAYESQTQRAGLDRMHGLRHAYAQRRYRELTGWACPTAGGPRRRTLRGEERESDRAARMTVAEELGHGRIEVAAVYLGS